MTIDHRLHPIACSPPSPSPPSPGPPSPPTPSPPPSPSPPSPRYVQPPWNKRWVACDGYSIHLLYIRDLIMWVPVMKDLIISRRCGRGQAAHMQRLGPGWLITTHESHVRVADATVLDCPVNPSKPPKTSLQSDHAPVACTVVPGFDSLDDVRVYFRCHAFFVQKRAIYLARYPKFADKAQPASIERNQTPFANTANFCAQAGGWLKVRYI